MGNRSCHQGDMEKSTDPRTPELQDREDQNMGFHPNIPGAAGPLDYPASTGDMTYSAAPILPAGVEGES